MIGIIFATVSVIFGVALGLLLLSLSIFAVKGAVLLSCTLVEQTCYLVQRSVYWNWTAILGFFVAAIWLVFLRAITHPSG